MQRDRFSQATAVSASVDNVVLRKPLATKQLTWCQQTHPDIRNDSGDALQCHRHQRKTIPRGDRWQGVSQIRPLTTTTVVLDQEGRDPQRSTLILCRQLGLAERSC